MLPLKEFSSWNTRPADGLPEREPYRKYYFLCEGANTERWYFEQLINDRKILNIHPNIDVRYMEKTGEDKNKANPKSLLKLAKNIEKQEEFKKFNDVIILVFDADIYKDKPLDYDKIVSSAKSKNYQVGVTYPSFELFLLLHIGDSVNKHILPNKCEILDNDFVGNKRYVSKLFTDVTQMNAKKNRGIADLTENLEIAIKQEKKLNQNVNCCIGKLTSNIGKIISDIQNDKGCD